MLCKLRKWQTQDKSNGGAMVWFWCPGCDEAHAVEVENKTKACWTWNGSEEKPTFSPSLLVTWGPGKSLKRCHSFVREGKIQFLNDSTHTLAGQTVDLPELPEWLR